MLAELVLERAGRTEARAETGRPGNRLDEAGRRVPVDERSPRHHVVDEAIAVDVLDHGAGRAPDEQRDATDGLESANGTVDAARQNLAGPCEELLAANGFLHDDPNDPNVTNDPNEEHERLRARST